MSEAPETGAEDPPARPVEEPDRQPADVPGTDAADEIAEADEVAEVGEVAEADEVAEVDDVDEVDDDRLPIELAGRLTEPADLASAVEAILFVVEAPVSVPTLAASLQQTETAIRTAVDTLRASYDERSAGFELRDVAGGVRLFTRAAHADIVEHFLQDGQRARLTQAALETLAVVAYRQPVTRARVSAIRGVNVDGVVRTLLARGLIVEVGTDPETGGGLFRTTDLFLERMGLQSLDELPSLAPLLPDLDGLDAVDSLDGLGADDS